MENRLSVLEPIIKSDASEGVTGPSKQASGVMMKLSFIYFCVLNYI